MGLVLTKDHIASRGRTESSPTGDQARTNLEMR